VAAARKALQIGSEWRTMDASARGNLMLKLCALMERDAGYLAALDTLDNGKPLELAKEDIQGSVDCIKYHAGWADKIHGDTIPTGSNK